MSDSNPRSNGGPTSGLLGHYLTLRWNTDSISGRQGDLEARRKESLRLG